MSTSATISYERPDGKIRSIYCHWDGYIKGVGKMLAEYYNSSNLDTLMDLGDLSWLGKIPQSDAKGWDISAPCNDDYCLSYRDRGDTDTDAVEYANFNDFKEKVHPQEFNYLYRRNTWYVFYDSVDDCYCINRGAIIDEKDEEDD